MAAVTYHRDKTISGLSFFRKTQTLENLEIERPKSLAIFYDLVSKEVDNIEWRLKGLETEYYAEHENWEREIRYVQKEINDSMRATKISNITSMTQLSDIAHMLEEMGTKQTVDLTDIRILRGHAQRVLEVVTDEFGDLIDDILHLMGFLDKYCLSFSDGDRDPAMETVMAYDKTITQFRNNIKSNTGKIKELCQKFEKDGLSSDDLGEYGAEIARRCQCQHTPFLVLFAEAVENIRNSTICLRKWIKADENYPEYLTYDIADLEKVKTNMERKFKIAQQRGFHLVYMIKSVTREVEDAEEEQERLHDKECLLRVEEEALLNEQHELEMDLELKEMRQENLQSACEEMPPKEYAEKYERLMTEMQIIKDRLPALNRKMAEMRTKTHWLNGRNEYKKEKEEELKQLKVDNKCTDRTVRSLQAQTDRFVRCLEKKKTIHFYKTNQIILKKVFQNIPLDIKVAGKKKKSDPLDKAVRVTAQFIDIDWMKLYRKLPFLPERGCETIFSDLAEINETYMRRPVSEKARQSLSRWRRMHTRPSIEQLKTALSRIKRGDIIEQIDEELTIKPKLSKAKKLMKPRIPRIPMLFAAKIKRAVHAQEVEHKALCKRATEL